MISYHLVLSKLVYKVIEAIFIIFNIIVSKKLKCEVLKWWIFMEFADGKCNYKKITIILY